MSRQNLVVAVAAHDLNGKSWAHHRFSRFNRSAGDIVLYALTAA
jgi:hypothetical protein